MTAAALDASTPVRNALRRRWTARFDSFAAALVAVMLAACMSGPPPRVETPQAPTGTPGGHLALATWADMSGWIADGLASTRPALQPNCQAMGRRADWSRVCATSLIVDTGGPVTMRVFFEDDFAPYRVVKEDGTDNGLITGYYEPLLRGSRTRHGVYQTPLYRMPPAWHGKTLPARARLIRNPTPQGQEIV